MSKSNLTRVLSCLYNTPLLITVEKWEILATLVNKSILGDTLQIGELEVAQKEVTTVKNKHEAPDKIALIPIYSTLVQRNRGFDGFSGLTSYASIKNNIQKALVDSSIAGILLDIDSPGGSVAGCFDLCDFIYEARCKKTIWAISNEKAYSAAYAIACSAEKVYTPRTGGVGSIGVIYMHVDESAKNEKEGIKYTPVYAGKRKVDGASMGPLSAEARKKVQNMVDVTYDIFTQTIARNRSITQDRVKSTEAAMFMGDQGVSNGLVDAVHTFDEVINLFSENIGKSNKAMSATLKGEMMNRKLIATALGLDVDASDEVILAAIKELNSKIEAGSESTASEVGDLQKRLLTTGQELKAAQADVTSLTKSAEVLKMDTFLSGAIEKGQILSRDLDLWKKQYAASPKNTETLISAMQPVVNLNAKGHESSECPEETEETSIIQKEVNANLGVDQRDYDAMPSAWKE